MNPPTSGAAGWSIRNNSTVPVMTMLPSGNVGIGTGKAFPLARLHVASDTLVNKSNVLQSRNATTDAVENWMWPRWSDNWMYTNFGAAGWSIRNNSTVPVMTMLPSGNVGIGTSAPAVKLHVGGTTRTSILEITGGSDIAEPYTIAAAGDLHPIPGMVVCIDENRTGSLRVSDAAYDHAVAGIISGANGVNVGLTLRQEGSAVADGDLPVANVGGVWCYVDADARGGGAIKPGDLLTTSSTPGHAMRADPAKGNGAILGKAMSRLDSGKGMVLVLVCLQ